MHATRQRDVRQIYKPKKKIILMLKKEVAQAVGLWLAEGDNKTKQEITFTNSQLELIKLFDKTLRGLFKNMKVKIYIYSPRKSLIVNLPINNCIIKNYIDKRANRPYFIWRVYSTRLSKEWKEIVQKLLTKKELQIEILKGFFAGEGNIKFLIKSSTRTIRIAQGKRVLFLEKILNNLNVDYVYSGKERAYIVNKRRNWDIFAKIKMADLHPLKMNQFWQAYNSFKQEHYDSNYLREEIYKILVKPLTSHNLATKFNRSQARIQDILIQLKKEKQINNFRIGSRDYWIRIDKRKILVSKLKQKYLDLCDKGYRRTYEFAKYFKVDHKSSYNRLIELEKLNLIKRNINKDWIRINSNRNVMII